METLAFGEMMEMSLVDGIEMSFGGYVGYAQCWQSSRTSRWAMMIFMASDQGRFDTELDEPRYCAAAELAWIVEKRMPCEGGVDGDISGFRHLGISPIERYRDPVGRWLGAQ